MQRPPPLDTPESDASLSLEGVRARRNSSLYSVGDQSMLASESSLDGQEDIPAMLTLEVERLLAVRWGGGWTAQRGCSRGALPGSSRRATVEAHAAARLIQAMACGLAVRQLGVALHHASWALLGVCQRRPAVPQVHRGGAPAGSDAGPH